MKTHQQPTEVVNRPFAKVVKVVSFLEFTSRVQIREVRHVRQNVNINWGEISEALVDVFVVEWNGLSRDELFDLSGSREQREDKFSWLYDWDPDRDS